MKKRSLLTVAMMVATIIAFGQESSKEKSLELYGFIMTDIGYNFNQIHPDWFDVIRPTKLPSYAGQYGTDGNTYFSVRQTRLGVKGYTQTPLGLLKTHFEFELFGTGVDAGQTTIRLRHAYGELGKWGVGQYWSPFMDIDVFPNTVEYWGPPGMAFFRNVQIRYMPIQGDTRLTIALERPGASADQGIYADRIELTDVKPRFKLPDLSAEYRMGMKWGYIELAGILRSIKWEDQGAQPYDLSGSATGWGLNLSTNIKLGKSDLIRGSILYGKGVENYMNDATVDVGIQKQPGNTTQPIKGVALPVTGTVAFLEHTWTDKLMTSVGYSSVHIDNADGSAGSAFKHGDYAIVNLVSTPVPNMMFCAELQYGTRKNFDGLYNANITKLQFSFKYNFSQAWYHSK